MQTIINADVREWAKNYDGPLFHACITDPPYEIGFMQRKWDATGVAFDPETWRLIGNTLLPGAFGAAFASSRGWHRLAVAIEDAGLRIMPSIFCWANGSSFPKATRIDTALDAAVGRVGINIVDLKQRLAEIFNASGKTRQQIDTECGFRASNYLTLPQDNKRPDPWVNVLPCHEKWLVIRRVVGSANEEIGAELDCWFAKAEREIVGQQTKARKSDCGVALPTTGDTEYKTWDITAPATPLAAAWEGHRYGGQILKNSIEPIIIFQKPYRGKPLSCITETGAGAINIDAGRIGFEDTPDPATNPLYRKTAGYENGNAPDINSSSYSLKKNSDGERPAHNLGRWPANFVLDREAAERLDAQAGNRKSGGNLTGDEPVSRDVYGTYAKVSPHESYEDEGGPSRFYYVYDWNHEVEEGLFEADPVFYTGKATRGERDAGIHTAKKPLLWSSGIQNPGSFQAEGTDRSARNPHPCVKPIALINWLASLLLPPDLYAPRRLLIPFAGSGSEMIGGMLAGWEEITGIENDPEYIPIAEARLKFWYARRHKTMKVSKPKESDPDQHSLFA